MQLFKALVLFAGVTVSTTGAFGSPATTEFEDNLQHQQYGAVVKKYGALSAQEKSEPDIAYMTAFACMREHDFWAAEPLLETCRKAGFNGFPGWTTTQEFSDRVHTLKRLCPPYFRKYSDGPAVIRVYGRRDDWLNSVYDAMPTMVKRGRAAFGDSTPPITFYMFDKLDDYVQFFQAASEHTPRDYQAGTGDQNEVQFCRFLPTGKECGPADLTWRQGCVLHEYGHALCNTVYGDTYLHDIPPWLNEGLADFLAEPLFGAHFSKMPVARARSFAAKGESPPTYDQLCHHFYDHPETTYILGKLLIARLFAHADVGAVGRLIATARERHGDFEAAIHEVFGVEPRKLYETTVADCWKK